MQQQQALAFTPPRGLAPGPGASWAGRTYDQNLCGSATTLSATTWRKARVEVCRNDARQETTLDWQNALEAEASVFLFGKDPSSNKSPDITPR